MRKHLSSIILAVILVAGLSFLLYPSVSNWWNERHQSRSIADYKARVADIDPAEKERLWEEAKQYNAELPSDPLRLKMREDPEKMDRYNGILDFDPGGMMGYIEIPCINTSMALYHGTDEATLQIAAGHVEGTSFPIGGPGTHAAISGHRGLPSAELFTNLDVVGVGDVFVLHILDEVLTYRVDQILTVLPSDMSALAIQSNRDYCTLITCTPYGINTHRLLVRGVRTDNAAIEQGVVMHEPGSEATKLDVIIAAPLLASPVLLVLLLIVIINPGKKRRKR